MRKRYAISALTIPIHGDSVAPHDRHHHHTRHSDLDRRRGDLRRASRGGRATPPFRLSTPLIIAVTLAYVGVAVNELFKGNYPMATVFAGYSLANLGFIAGVR